MRALVLGGNGFIGSHVVDELLSAGYDVNVFDRNTEKWRLPIFGVNYFLGDFADTTLLTQALQAVDVVVHLICSTIPSTSNLDPVADIQSNLVNTVIFLQLMLASNIKRIVFLSTGGAVYGQPSVSPVPETHALNPICSYGVVKVAIEKYLGMFAHLYDLRPMIIRPANLYGPRQGYQSEFGAVSTFMAQMLAKKKIQIWGNGTVKRDYLFVTDLAKLCRLAIEKDAVGVVNAGSGKAVSLNELVDLIREETRSDVEIEYTESRKFDVKEIVLDSTEAKRMFGWQPRISIQKGLSISHEWMKVSALPNMDKH
ncbi:MAG TPA: NAD-dependent epimerase/dehydratase family protein [Methylotenera sp.]|nr:NAD-dependent epimerase/dehydratase family protein [Methylotenera sp.]